MSVMQQRHNNGVSNEIVPTTEKKFKTSNSRGVIASGPKVQAENA